MKATLVEKRGFGIRDTLYKFKLAEPVVSEPGQFVEVEITKNHVPFLRRPISIFHADGDTVELLIRTVGAGTTQMLKWETGHETDMLVPLGRGFSWNEGPGDCLLVGGGIGAAPLGYLAEKLLDAGKNVHFLFLPRRNDAILGSFRRLKEIDLFIAENRTELPGAVNAALDAGKGAGGVYACGPDAMMRVTAGLCVQNNLECQVSMEERMGCGFGICAGCVVPVKSGDGFTYKKACVDGPVFNGGEVIFHE